MIICSEEKYKSFIKEIGVAPSDVFARNRQEAQELIELYKEGIRETEHNFRLEIECKCEKKEIRKKICSDGSVRYVTQCQRCGKKVVIKKALANGNEPILDETIYEKYWKEVADMHLAVKNAVDALEKEILHDANMNWQYIYDEHLKSEEWQQMRKRVLKRDGYLCQGCLINNAVHVHHKTYDNIGDEFMFELISLCKDCHSRLHGRQL